MAKNLDKKLKNILKEEKKSYLFNIAIKSQNKILERFGKEEDVDGDPFEPLKDPTKKERKSKGYGRSHPILKRTCNLKKSIKVIPRFNSMDWEITSLSYGEHLHKGRSNMEPRRILDLPREFKEGGKEESLIFNQTNENLQSRVSEIIQELSNRIDELV